MAQALSLIGAAFVLVGFAALQTGHMSPQHVAYHLVNLVGALSLAGSALITQTWGFVILNTVWAAMAGIGLLRPYTPEIAASWLSATRSRRRAAERPPPEGPGGPGAE